MTEPVDAEQIADLLLPLAGPHQPDTVVEAARTVAELVRRLNHATLSRSTLPAPPQLHHAVTGLGAAVHALRQTLRQLAARLDAYATDPRVGHDSRRDDPATACTSAADALRRAAAALDTVTPELDAAAQTTSHLDYHPTAVPRPGSAGTPPATAPPTPHHQPPTPRRRGR